MTAISCALLNLQHRPGETASVGSMQDQKNSETKVLFVGLRRCYARDRHRMFEPLQTVRCVMTETDPLPQELVAAVSSFPRNMDNMGGNLDAQLPQPIEEQAIE